MLAAAALTLALMKHPGWFGPAAIPLALAVLGTWDLLQTRHTIIRSSATSWRSDWIEASAREFR